MVAHRKNNIPPQYRGFTVLYYKLYRIKSTVYLYFPFKKKKTIGVTNLKVDNQSQNKCSQYF